MCSRPVLIGRGLGLNIARACSGVLGGLPHFGAPPLDNKISVAIAAGSHPFPSRTRKLRLPAPMVLGGRPPGRVGRRRISHSRPLRGPRDIFGPSPGRRSTPPRGAFRRFRASSAVGWNAYVVARSPPPLVVHRSPVLGCRPSDGRSSGGRPTSRFRWRPSSGPAAPAVRVVAAAVVRAVRQRSGAVVRVAAAAAVARRGRRRSARASRWDGERHERRTPRPGGSVSRSRPSGARPEGPVRRGATTTATTVAPAGRPALKVAARPVDLVPAARSAVPAAWPSS